MRVHCPARQDDAPALEEERGDPGTQLFKYQSVLVKEKPTAFFLAVP